MKKYILDTNICIYFLKGQFELDRRINDVGEINCFLSEITVAELKYGIENSSQKEKNRANILSFIEKFTVLPIYPALDIFAVEKARLRSIGKIADDFDLLIGSTAIYYDMVLVTRNVSDFDRLIGIQIEDWTK